MAMRAMGAKPRRLLVAIRLRVYDAASLPP